MVIRKNFLRYIYITQLIEFTLSEIKDFWKNNLLHIHGKVISEYETYHLLYKGIDTIEVEYVNNIINNIEAFLNLNDISLPDFLEKVCLNSSSRCIVPANEILKAIEPLIYKVNKTVNYHNLILLMLEKVCKLEFQEGHFFLAQQRNTGKEWNETIFKLEYLSEDNCFIDLEMLIGMVIKNSPLSFNLPVFERVYPLADCRSIEMIIGQYVNNYSYQNDKLIIQGICFGKKQKFCNFLKSSHLKQKILDRSEREVIVVNQDYYCSLRKRVVLKKNCAYSAPYYLLGVKYKSSNFRPKSFLFNLIDTMKKSNISDRILRRHRNLTDLCKTQCKISYDRKATKIYINGNLTIRGIGAKILREVITGYVFLDKKEFEYEEIRKSSYINLDPKRPALDVHIKRLSDRLRNKFHFFSINKLGKGSFRFTSDVDIKFNEV